MDAELDAIEAEEAAADGEDNKVGGESGSQADLSVERKLRKVQQLRDDGDGAGARKLLYEILTEGDADQVNVAKNILQQLDSD